MNTFNRYNFLLYIRKIRQSACIFFQYKVSANVVATHTIIIKSIFIIGVIYTGWIVY